MTLIGARFPKGYGSGERAYRSSSDDIADLEYNKYTHMLNTSTDFYLVALYISVSKTVSPENIVL